MMLYKTVYKCRRFAGQRALTIKSSLMSGCGYCHEPTENVFKNLWLRFPPSTIEIRTKEGIHT